MLTLIVGAVESFIDDTQEFVMTSGTQLDLEHSLASLSKWEAIYEKPFLAKKAMSDEEVLEYIKCMCLTPDFPPALFDKLSQDDYRQINLYLEKKMSATWFSEIPSAPRSSEMITAELVYYWMVSFQIPFECQFWHLNRLFTLIKVCNLKNAKPKTMSRNDMAQRNRELNAQRKAALGTKG